MKHILLFITAILLPEFTYAKSVTDIDVMIQHSESQKIDEDNYLFLARIKIKRSGRYVICGGFSKKVNGEVKLHKGAFLGIKYFECTNVNGDQGDVIPLKFKALKPPLNRDWSIQAFASEKDIETTG